MPISTPEPCSHRHNRHNHLIISTKGGPIEQNTILKTHVYPHDRWMPIRIDPDFWIHHPAAARIGHELLPQPFQ
jgi:hypothetical protein